MNEYHMKVFVISTETFPNGMAATQRIKCYAHALSKTGNECEVLIVNGINDLNMALGNIKPFGSIDGYTYKFVGNNFFRGRFGKILNLLRLLCFLLYNVHKRDCIFFYAYNLHLLSVVKFACKVKGAKLIIELCEHPSIQFEQCKAIDEAGTRGELKKLLKGVSGVIVISHTLQSLLSSIFNKQKVCLIPILYDESGKTNVTNQESIPNFPYIFHSGSLTQQKDGIVSLLEAFALAIPNLPQSVKYLMTGDINKSIDKDQILLCIKKYKLEDRVSFLGFLDEKELRTYQENAYMAIIYKENNLQNKYCFATKVGEYLRAGTLLVISRIGEPLYYLEDFKSCVYHDNDIKKLADIIVLMFSDENKRNKISQSGRDVAEMKFSYKHYTKIMVDFFNDIS